jgi:hypothetical protein
MSKPTTYLLPLLIAAITAAAAITAPAPTAAGTYIPPCTQDQDLITTSRQYLGHTLSIIFAFNNYATNRRNRAVLDMSQAAGDEWRVRYIASRAERDLVRRHRAIADYLQTVTDDITNNHLDSCFPLFSMNLAFNRNAPGIMSNYLANTLSQIDAEADAYAAGAAFDDNVVTPGANRPARGGGRLAR